MRWSLVSAESDFQMSVSFLNFLGVQTMILLFQLDFKDFLLAICKIRFSWFLFVAIKTGCECVTKKKLVTPCGSQQNLDFINSKGMWILLNRNLKMWSMLHKYKPILRHSKKYEFSLFLMFYSVYDFWNMSIWKSQLKLDKRLREWLPWFCRDRKVV